jgi:oligopeptide/dipeptide ABC transporter ATP-binding protein
MALLEVRDLCVEFAVSNSRLRAVDGLSFDVESGEVLGLVGESGSGKSVTARALLGLIPRRFALLEQGATVRGSIRLEGQELIGATDSEMRRRRGASAAMVFQDPGTALDPTMTIRTQLLEPLKRHQQLAGRDAREEAVRLLELVEIPQAKQRVDAYPHEFSGGMRQRVAIAIALACRPKLLIADEPTTALDVTVQAQLLDLLADIQAEMGMAILLITHNLGVVAGLCDRVAVMYAGQLVEVGSTRRIFDRPAHPYTRALLEAAPTVSGKRLARLNAVVGAPPNMLFPPSGCRFHPRCRYAAAKCEEQRPHLERVEGDEEPNWSAACWRTNEIEELAYVSSDA